MKNIILIILLFLQIALVHSQIPELPNDIEWVQEPFFLEGFAANNGQFKQLEERIGSKILYSVENKNVGIFLA
ncbi:MAG: hypothetical protein ACJAZ3_000933 [Sphingobacteriales bacterium]|jgi:hypothetical protein